jgi:hypothetical protein
MIVFTDGRARALLRKVGITPPRGYHHGLSRIGLVLTVIEVELTLAQSVPELSQFIPMAQDSSKKAKQTIDSLWRQRAVA